MSGRRLRGSLPSETSPNTATARKDIDTATGRSVMTAKRLRRSPAGRGVGSDIGARGLPLDDEDARAVAEVGPAGDDDAVVGADAVLSDVSDLHALEVGVPLLDRDAHGLPLPHREDDRLRPLVEDR